MSNYPKALIPAVALAAEYCNTLENARPDQTAETAAALLRLLPRIYITLSDIGGDEADQDGDDNGAVTATLKQEEYDAILSATTALLGEFDMYLDTPEYDMQFSDTAVAVSLAEQLADIYQQMFDMAYTLRDAPDQALPMVMDDIKFRFSDFLSQKICDSLRILNQLYRRKAL